MFVFVFVFVFLVGNQRVGFLRVASGLGLFVAMATTILRERGVLWFHGLRERRWGGGLSRWNSLDYSTGQRISFQAERRKTCLGVTHSVQLSIELDVDQQLFGALFQVIDVLLGDVGVQNVVTKRQNRGSAGQQQQQQQTSMISLDFFFLVFFCLFKPKKDGGDRSTGQDTHLGATAD